VWQPEEEENTEECDDGEVEKDNDDAERNEKDLEDEEEGLDLAGPESGWQPERQENKKEYDQAVRESTLLSEKMEDEEALARAGPQQQLDWQENYRDGAAKVGVELDADCHPVGPSREE